MEKHYVSNKLKIYLWSATTLVILFIVGVAVLVIPRSDELSTVPDAKVELKVWDGEVHDYDFTEASDHVGEKARVKGTVMKIFTAKSGVTFFDFCDDFGSCPFSAVIFASDMEKFKDISQYERGVTLTGVIKSYQGKAEMILSDPTQIE